LTFFRSVWASPTLVAVSAEGFLTRLGFGMAGFALPLYALSLGMGMAEIGLLYALRTGTTLAVKPAMGWAADRFGRKPTLVIAVALRCLVGLLLTFATLPWHLFVIRILQGTLSAARDPSVSALIAEHGDRRSMASAFSFYATARDLGHSLGFAAAGLLIEATGSYRVVFLIAFVGSCAALVTVIRYVREHREAGDEAPSKATRPADPSPERPAAISYRGLLPYAGFAVVLAGSAEMLKGLYPIIATQYAHLTAAEAGLTVSVSGVAILVAGPLFGWLSDRVSRSLALGARSIANTVSSLLYILFPSFAGFLVARVVDDTGKAAFRPTWGAMLAELSEGDRRRRARTITFVDTGYTVGEVLSPVAAGILVAAFGIPMMLGVRAGLGLVAEIQALWIFRKRGTLDAERPPVGTEASSEAAASIR
jgi:MFS family permease